MNNFAKKKVFQRFLHTVILLIICFTVLAQGELSPEVRVVTTNEHSYFISANSNGFSLSYQYGKRLDGFRKRIYETSFSYVRHPKEIRVENPYYQAQKKFVFGKLNTMFVIRSGIGLQREIYSIFDKGGIAIRYHYTFGVNVAMLKPIYYEVVDSTKIVNNVQYIYISDKLFDYSIHQVSDIYSRASFFKGINETKFIPGVFIKGGFSFAFSEKYESINAIELGAIIDVFMKPFQIMATEKHQRSYISLYIGYRFGKIKIKNKEDRAQMNLYDEEAD